MHAITFTCEIITPMFIAGTDSFTPELRAPSIKGALRFWWRAMHGDMAVAALKLEESRIFGGGGDHGMRSNVVIAVNHRHVDIQRNEQIGIGQQSGIGYLLYSSMFMQKRDCIRPGSRFTISFSSYSLESLETTVKAFACLVYFGGLGSRSRRGGGSLFVEAWDGTAKEHLENVLKVFNTTGIDTSEKLKVHIENHIRPFLGSSPAIGSYSALNGASLYVLKPKTDWKKALEEIGLKFKTVRNRIQSDIGGTPNFGIPIRHKSGLMMIAGITYQDRNSEWKAKESSDRRASPLIIKLIKTNDQCFFPIALHLQGELLKDSVKIVDKKAADWSKDGRIYREMTADDSYIKTNFLDTLKELPTTL
ncbi:MAG TPA: type III-B CRISPR module RAMP protein Cmr1 [Negativicutes bacterium]|nr:type III-B CRISPR module RAMP protein Cmr1 [Negativicutes bacterium]